MTVRLLIDWYDSRNGRQYVAGNLLTTDAGTESGLVAAKVADANLAGGTNYVATPVVNQYRIGQSVRLTIKLVEEFDSEVPSTLEELITLPGVGRKTANVVLGHAFDTPGITVDTHFGRLSRRFGWTTSMDPVKVEHEVGELIPQKEWTNLSQRMIWHGRRICHSRKPACGACPLAKRCPSVGIGEMDVEKAKLLVKTDKDFR